MHFPDITIKYTNNGTYTILVRNGGVRVSGLGVLNDCGNGWYVVTPTKMEELKAKWKVNYDSQLEPEKSTKTQQ